MGNLVMSDINSDIYFTESFEKGDIIIHFYKLTEKGKILDICNIVIIPDLNVMSIEPNKKYIVDEYDYLVLTRSIQMSIVRKVVKNSITVSNVMNSDFILISDEDISLIKSYVVENNLEIKKYENEGYIHKYNMNVANL